MSLIADLRAEYLRRLCGEVLGFRKDAKVLNIADKESRASREIASRMIDLIGEPTCSTVLTGQTAGNEFTRLTMEFLRKSFQEVHHLRPGSWVFAMNPSETSINLFDQFGHLADLKRFLQEHKELTTAIGSDYIVTPDIIVAREPVEEHDVNARDELVAIDEPVARRSPLRAANEGLPILHASISCKYTMRSDRAQNTRTEALNLIRNRKGRNPHIVAVTVEPLPSPSASIAMGTGDLDCTYHAALDELVQATVDRGFEDAEEMLRMLIDGRRLRDISDLPFDLAA